MNFPGDVSSRHFACLSQGKQIAVNAVTQQELKFLRDDIPQSVKDMKEHNVFIPDADERGFRTRVAEEDSGHGGRTN